MSKANLPDLPSNQRWSVSQTFWFVDVKLQERRWWGWRTIASSTGSVDEGADGIRRSVKLILDRDYIDGLMREEAERRAARRREIPFGTTR